MHNINLQKLRFRSNNATTTTLLSSFAEMRNWIIVYYNNVPVLYLLHNLIIKEVRARYCTVPLKKFCEQHPYKSVFQSFIGQNRSIIYFSTPVWSCDNFGQTRTYMKKHKAISCVTNCKKYPTIKLNKNSNFIIINFGSNKYYW